MRRIFHTAILRYAAWLVPAAERSEWLAEWRAELCYVDHDATAFCLGSFRDALSLRQIVAQRGRHVSSLDSPWRCVLFVAGLAASSFAVALPFSKLWPPPWSLPGVEQFAMGCLWMFLISLAVLSTLDPLDLGEYTANRYAPSRRIRLRRWLFLAAKIVLIIPVPVFACTALLPLFPGAPWILLFGWIFGFRWALKDQRQRCPVCLHLLAHPIRIGSPAQSIFAWYGTELICTRGHGMLYVPGAPTSWSNKQRWHYLDPTWSSLLP